MTDKGIQIKRMADYGRNVCYEAASVFVDGYYKDLSFFNKDKERLKAAFKSSFSTDIFYLAELDGAIAGILACSNNRQRAMHIDRTIMKNELGFVMGNLAYHLIKNEFNPPLTCSDDTAYIECVATGETARGKGVCTELFQHVMQQLPYGKFILEVADTNQNAYRLYKKLGFTETGRKNVKYSKIKGLNEIIYMQWCK